ncbi:cytidine deaminase-like protein [Mycena olivaceomarginata]|nr:cytidine deaminase-like protein [Mycena olivaceomarginata]KAJ7841081.1 cytidine deaminase-like protein [Mycena olivaceomarginata]
MAHLDGILAAYAEANKGYEESGIPIGAVIVDRSGKILGRGHNQRIQKSSPTLHAEVAALEDAGRQRAEVYRTATLYTTLSPCSMCTGAILLYKIPRVVIGENVNFKGDEDLLRARGVEVTVVNNQDCKELMRRFIEERPEEWNEDIGEAA